MSLLEIIAAVFGFLCVYFYIIRNVWSWPTGLVQVGLLILVFYEAKLYADMILHIAYVGLQIYGWVVWRQSKKQHHDVIQVRSLSYRQCLIALTAILGMSILFSGLLIGFTDASLPVIDSIVAATSLVAQYLLAKRYVENWIFWIFVDVVGIGLFAYKELYPTAILYVLFLAMAITGWVTWQKLGTNH